MTRLIIARHGNTFGPDDTPTRVGARTDLPLVQSGVEQAVLLGLYLKLNNLHPDQAFASNLQRTIMTAKFVLSTMECHIDVQQDSLFDEIDYGPDENQTEDKVIARIGEQAIKDWDDKAVVPNGWKVTPQDIIDGWKKFADSLPEDSTTLVVTSNGTARFAPYLTGDFDSFAKNHKIKLSTGACAILERDKSGNWHVQDWNIKPKDVIK